MKDLLREYQYTLKCLKVALFALCGLVTDVLFPSLAKNEVVRFLEFGLLSAGTFYLIADLVMMLLKANTERSSPSRNAVFLFYLFLDAATCDSLVGDLEERYKIIFNKFGRFRADLWYWKEATRSVGPVAWGWIKKLILKPTIALGSWVVGHGLLKDTSIIETLKQVLVEWLQRIRG